MWVTETVSRQIVFSGADVWHIAKSVLSEDFPIFSIHVGRRETPGRFAGGGLGAGLMLVVVDEDGYELDYGQRVIFEACSQAARDLGYRVDPGVQATLCRDALDPYRGKLLPDDDDVAACVIRTETTKRRFGVRPAMSATEKSTTT